MKKLFLLTLLFSLFMITTTYAINDWLIVGASGRVSNSTNGQTWTMQDLGSMNFYDTRYVYKDNLWVMVGSTGSLYTSNDGYIWTSRNSGFGSNQINAIMYSEKEQLYVIVGASGQVATSTNGILWTLKNTYTTLSLNDITYNNKARAWIIVGADGKILRSTNNCETFITINSNLNTEDLYAIRNADDDDKLVAVGELGKVIYSTDTGLTWKVRTITTTSLRDLNYNNPMNKWYIVGDDRKVFATYNFINVTQFTAPFLLSTDDVFSIEQEESFNQTYLVGSNGQMAQWLHNGTFKYINNTKTGFSSSAINKIKFKQKQRVFFKNISLNGNEMSLETQTAETENYFNFIINRQSNITYVLRDTINNYNIYNTTVNNVNDTHFFANLPTGRYSLNIQIVNGFFTINSDEYIINVFDNIIPTTNEIINTYTPFNDNQVLNSKNSLDIMLKKKANCDLYLDNNKILDINDMTSYSFKISSLKEENHNYYWYCEYTLNNILYYEFSRTVPFIISNNPSTINLIFGSSDFDIEDKSLWVVSPCLNKGNDFSLFVNDMGKYRSNFNRGGAYFRKVENNMVSFDVVSGDYNFCIYEGQTSVKTLDKTSDYFVKVNSKMTYLGKFSIPNNITSTFAINIGNSDLYAIYTPEHWGLSWTLIITNVILFFIGLLLVYGGMKGQLGSAIVMGSILILISLGFSLITIVFKAFW